MQFETFAKKIFKNSDMDIMSDSDYAQNLRKWLNKAKQTVSEIQSRIFLKPYTDIFSNFIRFH